MAYENIDKYLEATSKHLGIEDERYGGGYRAIVAHRCWVDFLFDKLEGDDIHAQQIQSFFAENPLFPAAHGKTPTDALAKLNQKLGILYTFAPKDASYKWSAIPNFVLKAEHDCDPDEEQTWYDVEWDEVVSDLRSSKLYFYEDAKAQSGRLTRRNLHALINFEYGADFTLLDGL